MSWDSEDDPPRTGLAAHPVEPLDGRDLEAIVTLMDFAALWLTKKPGDTFSFDELLCEMRGLGGPEIELREQDVRIVLGSYGKMIGKRAGKYFVK